MTTPGPPRTNRIDFAVGASRQFPGQTPYRCDSLFNFSIRQGCLSRSLFLIKGALTLLAGGSRTRLEQPDLLARPTSGRNSIFSCRQAPAFRCRASAFCSTHRAQQPEQPICIAAKTPRNHLPKPRLRSRCRAPARLRSRPKDSPTKHRVFPDSTRRQAWRPCGPIAASPGLGSGYTKPVGRKNRFASMPKTPRNHLPKRRLRSRCRAPARLRSRPQDSPTEHRVFPGSTRRQAWRPYGPIAASLGLGSGYTQPLSAGRTDLHRCQKHHEITCRNAASVAAAEPQRGCDRGRRTRQPNTAFFQIQRGARLGGPPGRSQPRQGSAAATQSLSGGRTDLHRCQKPPEIPCRNAASVAAAEPRRGCDRGRRTRQPNTAFFQIQRGARLGGPAGRSQPRQGSAAATQSLSVGRTDLHRCQKHHEITCRNAASVAAAEHQRGCDRGRRTRQPNTAFFQVQRGARLGGPAGRSQPRQGSAAATGRA
ncbi:hypothetical protein PCL1606_26110 [Pseudomonas chlororaphis]|uniref:Uncharacterized protein n=1 Tax=Pseudomonas chlororaphis TaxID=587753 RepID=A0A0D5XYA0_9PSED|nr:hypothetical protein PCL1606_26110 [Pseudomonas chlororaphis]